MPQLSSPKTASAKKPLEAEGSKVTAAQLARSLGVTCHKSDVYAVGGYRYTDLADAIAQARRMTKLESELL